MTNLVAVLVWLLLLVIVVGLGLLLWTRWGQYRSFAKCLGLSVVLHAALLLFGSTLDLAHRLRQPDREPQEEVVWLERVETEAVDQFAGLGGNSPLTEPWDYFSPDRQLTSPELDYTPPPVTPPQPEEVRQSETELSPVDAVPELPAENSPTADPELVARRERDAETEVLTQNALAPGVPEVTAERSAPPVPVTGPLAAPETEIEPRRVDRSGGAPLTLKTTAGLPEPELRVEPHALSEPLVRRGHAAPRESQPALADEIPLRPDVPNRTDEAPPSSSLSAGLVTAEPLPRRPVEHAGPQRRSRHSGQQRLDELTAQSIPPDVIAQPRSTPPVAGRGAEPARARRQQSERPGTGVPRVAARTGLTPDAPSTTARRSDPPRRLPGGGLLGPAVPARAPDRVARRSSARTGGLQRLNQRLGTRPLPAVPQPSTTAGRGIPVRTPGELASVPTELRLRVSSQRREVLLRRGGSPETEQAVEAALAWLAAHQSRDGRWDADGFTRACPEVQPCGGEGTLAQGDTAITGLALLAFLGAGHTHQGGEYASTVAAGLRWLVAQEKADGDLRAGGRMYAQGIATIALCEAYALSRDPALWEPAYRAAMFVARAQNPATGAWRYQPQAVIGDTSVFGWQLLALRSARLAGIDVPQATWDRARAWLPRVSWGKAGGLASYLERSVDRNGPTPPMTAEALACRLFLGASPEDAAVREAVDYLVQNPPDYRLRNVYYWYYASLSLSQVGGQPWQVWNEQMKAILLRTQRRSGHAKGSWDPAYNVAWDTVGGRIYTTALSTLCLEVYYRYAYREALPAARAQADPLR